MDYPSGVRIEMVDTGLNARYRGNALHFMGEGLGTTTPILDPLTASGLSILMHRGNHFSSENGADSTSGEPCRCLLYGLGLDPHRCGQTVDPLTVHYFSLKNLLCSSVRSGALLVFHPKD